MAGARRLHSRNLPAKTPEFVQYVLEKELISEIIGVDAADLWEARNRWNHKLPEHAAAKMALEAAFYDLAAKERKIPLYQMFGWEAAGEGYDQPPSWNHGN